MMILNQRSIPIASGVILNFVAIRDGQSAREVYYDVITALFIFSAAVSSSFSCH